MNTSSATSSVKKAVKAVSKLVRDDELTWEDLKAIEKRRRAILKRTELPFYRILSFWDGTCLRILASDPLFWATILIYIGARILAQLAAPDAISSLNSADIGIIGGFLSFFLVFFVVQSNNRLDAQYNKSMAIKGRIFDVATIARVSLPREMGLRIVRYLNAANLAGYIGLSDTYTSVNFFQEINRTKRMLTDQEVDRMFQINLDQGGSASRELIVWAMMEVQKAMKDGIIDSRLAAQLRDLILAQRSAIGALFNFKDQPISFFYIHFLVLLSAFYLPLFAVSAGFNAGTGDDAYWATDVLSGLIVILQAIFVIGLRLLGQKMSDPYGDDLEDLSVMHYINFTHLMSSRILAAHESLPLNGSVEGNLCQERTPIGQAWEYTSENVVVNDDVATNNDENNGTTTDEHVAADKKSTLFSGYF